MTAPFDIDADYVRGDPTGETPVVVLDERKPRRRLVPADLDLRNTWQVAVGAILLPLGIALIILGWHGAAYGKVDQQQIPYLISGGLLGLAIVIVGCFFYFSHWLYRIYDQADLHHQEAVREQTEMIKALLDAVQASGPAGAGWRPDQGGNGGAQFVATPTGSNFHTPGCPIVAKRYPNVRTVTADEADDMTPCRICEPLKPNSAAH